MRAGSPSSRIVGSGGEDRGRLGGHARPGAGRRRAFVDEQTPADVVVDALFGTGFRGKPRPRRERAIAEVNAASVPIVAVDLPSGVDASTGKVAGAAVQAAVTVTFHAPKVGHVVAPGRFHAGELVVADIGLAGADPGPPCDPGSSSSCRAAPSATTSTRRDPCSSSAGRSG